MGRRIVSLFTDFGSADYIGEPLNITEHSVQAAMVARARGESEEVQIAALFHDVGHLLGLEAGYPPAMDGCGTGAALLSITLCFGVSVCILYLRVSMCVSVYLCGCWSLSLILFLFLHFFVFMNGWRGRGP